jgi:hypothetical protein
MGHFRLRLLGHILAPEHSHEPGFKTELLGNLATTLNVTDFLLCPLGNKLGRLYAICLKPKLNNSFSYTAVGMFATIWTSGMSLSHCDPLACGFLHRLIFSLYRREHVHQVLPILIVTFLYKTDEQFTGKTEIPPMVDVFRRKPGYDPYRALLSKWLIVLIKGNY